MGSISGWKKVAKSYWDERKNPLIKRIAVYRNPGYLGYPEEIIIDTLTKEGVEELRKDFGLDTSKKYMVLLFDRNSVGKNLTNLETHAQALKFATNWMREHPKG